MSSIFYYFSHIALTVESAALIKLLHALIFNSKDNGI